MQSLSSSTRLAAQANRKGQCTARLTCSTRTLRFCREVLQLTAGDRLFSSSRLPFAYGLGNSLSFPLLNGATSILCREKPTAEVISRTITEARPTIFFCRSRRLQPTA
jgi:acyl-coenzyme A synthetase/AMP-(fatty) acid ligase